MGKDHICNSTQWDKETGPKPNTIFGQRPYMGFNTVGQGNQTQRQLELTQLGQGNQTQRLYMGKDHNYMGFNTMGQGNRTQRPYMGPKDHIWDSTQWDRETGPKDHRIQHSWDRKTGPKDHIWDSTQLGQGNWTQRPFMGPKDHIWDPKTIYGTQRPYMGPKDHIWDSTQWDRETGPKDHIWDSTQLGQGKWTQRPNNV